MKIIIALLFWLGFSVLPAQSQEQSLSDEEFAMEFTINNTIYTVYHEVGHMLIGELGIPVLAREEDAADNLATLLLLSAETREADNALIDAVDAYFLSEEANIDSPIEDAELYGVHSLDAQRAFQIVCLAVGADPEIFSEIAESAGVDTDRQDDCAFDFQQASDSWNAVLEPHIHDGSFTPDIEIAYDRTSTYAAVADMLKSSKILELVATNILTNYSLPRPVALRASECGVENAFYDPEIGQITMCYELAALYYTQGLSPD